MRARARQPQGVRRRMRRTCGREPAACQPRPTQPHAAGGACCAAPAPCGSCGSRRRRPAARGSARIAARHSGASEARQKCSEDGGNDPTALLRYCADVSGRRARLFVLRRGAEVAPPARARPGWRQARCAARGLCRHEALSARRGAVSQRRVQAPTGMGRAACRACAAPPAKPSATDRHPAARHGAPPYWLAALLGARTWQKRDGMPSTVVQLAR